MFADAFEGMQSDVMVVSYANKSQMRTQKATTGGKCDCLLAKLLLSSLMVHTVKRIHHACVYVTLTKIEATSAFAQASCTVARLSETFAKAQSDIHYQAESYAVYKL